MIEIEQVEKPVEVKPKLQPLKLNDRGVPDATNQTDLMRICSATFNQGFAPKQHDTIEKLYQATLLVRSFGFLDNAVAKVAIIHGVPSFFGDLPLALAQRHPDFEWIQETFIDINYKEINRANKNLHEEPFAAICVIKRKGSEPVEFFYTMANATKAGQYKIEFRDKEDERKFKLTPWWKYTQIMLKYKARSLALKSQFADALNGLSIAEYDFDSIGEPIKDVTPKPSDLLNGV